MPPVTRTRNSRLANNENDENTNATTHLTRAKAATLNVDELALPAKGLQSKKTGVNANPPARKRAALGDVSNVTKVEGVAGKKAVTKAGLVSKAAQPSGVQKKTAGARPALSSKEINKKVEAPSRSGPGPIKSVQKRRAPASSVVVAASSKSKENVPEEEVEEEEEAEPLRKGKVDKKTKTETIAEALARKEAAPLPPVVSATHGHEYPEGVENLDRDDIDDPLMVAEYANEIFEYLRDLECTTVPNPQYMSHQDDLEWKTRGILVDWLIEVHTRFHLLPETLFLAVNIIDRFLSEKVVQLDRLQLVGITAMFIASKYEEVLSPHIANFRHVADDGFSESEILSAERFILSTLNYDLSYPNPMNFLRRISKADNYDIQSRTIGKYLMEISLLDHRFMAYRPSHIAAGAMYVARLILDRGEWDDTIEYYAGYSEEEIEPVFQLMVDYMARPVIHEAFFKKYASKKFLKASMLTRQWAKKNAHLYGITDLDLSLDQIS